MPYANENENGNVNEEQEIYAPEPSVQNNAMPSYMVDNKITFEDIKAHMIGPSVALVLHIIILVLVFTMAAGAPPKEADKNVSVEMTKVEIEEPPPEKEEPPPPPDPVETTETFETTTTNPTPVVFDTEVTASVSDVESVQAVTDVELTPNLTIRDSKSALILPGALGSRSPGGIKKSLGSHGGTLQCEDAVLRALRWLKKVQNPDGSWGEPNSPQPALTAVATLTFLAHGEIPATSDEFGDTVMRALQRLIVFVNTMRNPKSTIANGGNGYANAMVAYDESEGYAMTKIPDLEEAMNKIIYSIVQGQNKYGGFDYNLNVTERSDLSVGGWNYQALKAAYTAGCTVEGLPNSIAMASKCIRTTNLASNGYGFSYTAKGSATDSMTSVGTLCLQLFVYCATPEAKQGYNMLKARTSFEMDYKKPNLSGTMPLYTWYYMTQAVFQETGGNPKNADWAKWNKTFREL